ncbi:hypothetical protein Tco_0603976 [Tanacetum coccineum]
MRTRSQARKRQQQQVQQTSVESSNLEKPDNPSIVTMADNRTMAQLLEAHRRVTEDAIVIPNHLRITLKSSLSKLRYVNQETKLFSLMVQALPPTASISSDVADTQRHGFGH